MTIRNRSSVDRLKRLHERENLESHYVNLYRKVFNTNLGLFSKDINAMSETQLTEV